MTTKAATLDTVTHVGFGKITKATRQADGTVTFEASKATGPDLDLDDQIVDPEWAKGAMHDWFTTGANLREQHGAVAAGKGLTLEERGTDQYVSGVVVDPTSATKVEKQVLQGLSIGIKGAQVVKDAAAPNGRIVGGRIVEVSLVDRPANPTCKLVLAKSAGTVGAPVEFVEELTTEPEEAPQMTRAELDQYITDLAALDTASKEAAKAAKAEKKKADDTKTDEAKAAEKAAKAEKKSAKKAAQKTAKAESKKAALEELNKLNERIAKLEGEPAPGGPARGPQATTTTKQDGPTKSAELLAKADRARDAGDLALAASYEHAARTA